MPTLFRPTFRDKTTGELKRVRKYYAKVRYADGRLRKVPLSTNKAAAEMMLRDLLAKIERQKSGLTDPHEEHRKRPLAEHLEEWRASLNAAGGTEKHVCHLAMMVRRIIDGIGAAFIADVTAGRVQEYLATLRRPGAVIEADAAKLWYTKNELAELLGIKPCAVTPLIQRHTLAAHGNGKARRFPKETAEALIELRRHGKSTRTLNLHLAAIKQFIGWLVRERRILDNPLVSLRGGNVEHDRRREFATLEADELRRIIQAAAANPLPFRGLTGPDRAKLYTLAIVTAFRPVELSRLTVADFILDGEVAYVRLDGNRTKNGNAAEQPLTAEAAGMFRDALRSMPKAGSVFPGEWYTKAADMIRLDLDAAGLPHTKPGTDGHTLAVSFYSLRGPLGGARRSHAPRSDGPHAAFGPEANTADLWPLAVAASWRCRREDAFAAHAAPRLGTGDARRNGNRWPIEFGLWLAPVWPKVGPNWR